MDNNNTNKNITPNDTGLDIRVTALLIRLGINACSKGYSYLRCAIMQAYNEPESAIYVTKTLYPRVARKCKAPSICAVERSCRHAIQSAFNDCDNSEFEEIFGLSATECPTCSVFIRGAADYLHQEDETDYL